MKKMTIVKIGIKASVVAAIGTAIYAVKAEKKKIAALEKENKQLRDTVNQQSEVIKDFQKYFDKPVDPAE